MLLSEWKLFRRVLFSVRSRALLPPSFSTFWPSYSGRVTVIHVTFDFSGKTFTVVNYRLPQVFCSRSLKSWISVNLPSGFLSVSIFFRGARNSAEKGKKDHMITGLVSLGRQQAWGSWYKIILAHLAKCNKKEPFAVILPLKYGIQVKRYPLNDVLSNLVHCSALALIATLRVTFGAW